MVPIFQYLIFVILDRVDSISDIRLLFVVANFHFFAFPVLNDVLASDLRDGQAFVGQEEVFVILAADVTNHFGVRVVAWGIFNALESSGKNFGVILLLHNLEHKIQDTQELLCV